MSIYQTILNDRKIIAVNGTDRVGFLQNLITQNIDGPTDGTCMMAALLTPQGKLLYDFIIYVEADRFLLDVDAQIAEACVKKLTLYKLRADVSVTLTDMQVCALWQEDGFPCPPMSGFYEDPRHEGLGLRGYFETVPQPSLPEKPLAAWHENRLKLGIAQGPTEMPPGSVFPLEYGFAQINAIDFKKGCFVGQEVTSRTHRKGSLRKKLRPIALPPTSAEQGTAIMTAERVAGELVAQSGTVGLALIREDAIAEPLHLPEGEVTPAAGLFDMDTD